MQNKTSGNLKWNDVSKLKIKKLIKFKKFFKITYIYIHIYNRRLKNL